MALNADEQKRLNALHKKVSNFDENRLKPLEEEVKNLKAAMSQLKAAFSTSTLSAPSRDNGRVAELEKDVERLKNEKNFLQERFDELDKAKNALQEKFDKLTDANSALQGRFNELDKAKNALQEKFDKLTDANADLRAQLEPFAGLLDIYARYSALELVKANGKWREILPTDTPVHFLLCGSQTNTITSFWKKLRNCCESPGMADSPEWKVLLDVLRFLLEQYNSTLDTPVWKWMEDRAGERFDDERHTRDKSGSQYSGNIAKVLLPGIWNRRENRAVQKCVVVVATEGGLP